MMNYHLLFYRAGGRIREYKRHLQTRRAFCLLTVVTYTNSLLFSWMMFRQFELFVDILFCLASCLIGISVTGLYLNKPLIMVPDVVFKISLATCAFFFSVKEVDDGKEGAPVCLLFVLTGYALQFYENYFLFNAIVHVYRRVPPCPPPVYDFFTVTAPQKEQAIKPKHEEVENGAGPSDDCHNSTDTPPPSYAIALARMARKMAVVPTTSNASASTVTTDDSLPPKERAEGRQFEILMHTSSLP